MKNIKLLGILILLVSIVSCKPNSGTLTKQIKEGEKALYTSGNPIPDKTKVKEMMDLYIKFVDNFPKDSLAPVYLFSAANLAMNTNQNDNAITLLDRIIKDYASYPKLPEAYFLKAFIYDNNIKNINKAREAYTDFLQKFPKNDLAGDAAISLNNLGKTPEQIINEFQVKEIKKSDSVAVAQQQKKK
jgi:outer membrane protein assembly factor BamD (BamD/ComL family)